MPKHVAQGVDADGPVQTVSYVDLKLLAPPGAPGAGNGARLFSDGTDLLVYNGANGPVNLTASGNQKEVSWFMPMTGVVDNKFSVVGTQITQASAQVGDYAVDFGAMNHHLSILVNSITTGGVITISGTSVSESTGLPTALDTEDITVDTTAGQLYQSVKKWLEITNVDISTGTIVNINYDVGVVGYIDFGNMNVKLVGYRLECKTSGTSADVGVNILRVKNDGSGKYSLVTLEDFGVNSTAGGGDWIDDLRTGGNDRSYTMGSNLAPNNGTFVLKMVDFETFFSSDENHIDGGNEEGLIINFNGKPSGGISQIDHATLTLYYQST